MEFLKNVIQFYFQDFEIFLKVFIKNSIIKCSFFQNFQILLIIFK